MRNYQQAAAYLGAKTDRPLSGRATRLQRRSAESIAVKYQATDVVTYYADGRTVLESGGYQTSTTKARFGEYSDARIYQNKGLWYVATIGPNGYPDWEAPRRMYRDGLTIAADGTISGWVPAEDTERAKRRLDRAVREYIKGFCQHVAANGLEAPGGGDCWGCYFQHAAPSTATSWGGAPAADRRPEPMGYDHYISHFGGTEEEPEPYYVPSMVWRAVQDRGNPSFCYQLIQADAKRGDTRQLQYSLRSHFRKIKPAILKCWGDR